MAIPSLEELDSFKYSNLQNLAKSLGLRADLRADKLLKALKNGSPTSASSWDATEMQISSQEQAKREPIGHITKTRRRCKNSDSQQDRSEMKISDHTEFQNQEKQENQDLRTVGEVPSPLDEDQGEENAVSTGKRRINDNKDSKIGFSKPGKSKRTISTTPNFKKLHEARFKEMKTIDQYIERKKKHFEEHNSFNELEKQPVTKEGVSTLCGKRSAKRSILLATKMNVRFSAATKDNEHKRSLTKIPARKSPHVTACGSTTKGQAVLGTCKLKTGNSASVVTPFRLTTEAAQTPVSNKKLVFDLKANLSCPLNHEPHKGKLKPWGQPKENNSLKQHVNRVSFHKKTYKLLSRPGGTTEAT
uniref:Nucleolar and spindle associated protein 1 n=1 Tax=Canis lupus familiaris TaxID=9615 RepID=A0A8I3PL43_CANLF